MLEIVQAANGYLSDYVLIALLTITGIYFTIKTRFVQIRCFGEGARKFFGEINLEGGKQKSGLTSFQALTTAIAAQVGTGNIVGACGAILIGGPGAIFWMWVIAFFGMATIYSEAVLAVETRTKDSEGNIHGGPVYYIKRAFPKRFGSFLAGLFSVAAILALGFMGCMVQSNSIGETCQNAFGTPSWAIGIAVTAIAALIFIGGIQRVASVTEKLVPIMAVLYIAGCLAIIISRITSIPQTFAIIFKCAFRPESVIGGSAGYALKTAISQGAKRGLFSNEAGMGSTPHAHAMANVKMPHEQGVVAMMGLFIDTFIVLTMTALVVISTCYAGNGELAHGIVNGITKTNLAPRVFSSLMGDKIGPIFVAICLLFFAFSTILSWNFFGEVNAKYLFRKSKNASAIAYYTYAIISLAFIFLGSMLSNDLVWELQDFFNQIIVIPNVIALFALSRIVAKASGCGKKSD